MKRSTWGVYGAFFLSMVAVCQARGGDPPAPPAKASPPAAAPGAASSATVLARVNGKEIPSRQLEQTVRMYLEGRSQNPSGVPPERVKALRKQLLDSLISSEVLYQATLSARITVKEEAVEQQIQELRGRFPSEKEFSSYIQSQGITLDDMRGRIRRNIATEELINKEVDSKVKVTDEEIAKYYRENRERMRREESVKLSEIFVRADAKSSAASKSQARRKIEALLKEVQSGKDFAALARAHSEGADASQGGEMGYVPRRGTLPVLAEVAFQLKVGEVSDVVESPFGFHILKVTDRRPPGDVKLEEAKPQISKMLFQKREQEAFDAYLEKLKTAAKIEVLVPEP